MFILGGPPGPGWRRDLWIVTERREQVQQNAWALFGNAPCCADTYLIVGFRTKQKS